MPRPQVSQSSLRPSRSGRRSQTFLLPLYCRSYALPRNEGICDRQIRTEAFFAIRTEVHHGHAGFCAFSPLLFSFLLLLLPSFFFFPPFSFFSSLVGREKTAGTPTWCQAPFFFVVYRADNPFVEPATSIGQKC